MQTTATLLSVLVHLLRHLEMMLQRGQCLSGPVLQLVVVATRRVAKRRGLKQTTLQDRLAMWANEVREQASQLPPGPAGTSLR